MIIHTDYTHTMPVTSKVIKDYEKTVSSAEFKATYVAFMHLQITAKLCSALEILEPGSTPLESSLKLAADTIAILCDVAGIIEHRQRVFDTALQWEFVRANEGRKLTDLVKDE